MGGAWGGHQDGAPALLTKTAGQNPLASVRMTTSLELGAAALRNPQIAEELEALEDKKKRRTQRVANMLLDQMEVRQRGFLSARVFGTAHATCTLTPTTRACASRR